jgi:hypothetical protein
MTIFASGRALLMAGDVIYYPCWGKRDRPHVVLGRTQTGDVLTAPISHQTGSRQVPGTRRILVIESYEKPFFGLDNPGPNHGRRTYVQIDQACPVPEA